MRSTRSDRKTRSTQLVLLATGTLVAAVAACMPADAARDVQGPANFVEAPSAPVDSTRDTATVVVTGPTLVAFFPSNTQARVDADSGDFATATDDFMYYLGNAQDSLAARGVKVEVRIADTLTLETPGANGRRWQWVPQKDSSEVGYYLVTPGKAPLILYGVQVTEDLLEAVDRQRGATGEAPR